MSETRGISTRDNHYYRVFKFTSFDHMDRIDLVTFSGSLLKEDGESMWKKTHKRLGRSYPIYSPLFGSAMQQPSIFPSQAPYEQSRV